jgi:16S rRNA pseudouridine516 synthase
MAGYHTAMKLSRIISNQNGVSRKQANGLIASRCVAIDGLICSDPAQDVTAFEQVTQQGEIIQAGITAYYLMMNKPAGILSATRDSAHTTVIDLIDTPAIDDLHIAGRLDRASTGLLILTNDGHWSRRLTDPHLKKPKVYCVSTASAISSETTKRFADGIWFEHEQIKTSPAQLEILQSNRARVTIYEGRYHQIKRMFHAVGNRVTALHREKMGIISLDTTLPSGGYRPLTACEIGSVAWETSPV